MIPRNQWPIGWMSPLLIAVFSLVFSTTAAWSQSGSQNPPPPPPVPQPIPPPRVVDPAVELVQSFYQRYLKREPDGDGLQYWVTVLHQGQSPANVLASFLGGQEYYVKHNSTPQEFVRGLYTDLLRRDPTPAELDARLAAIAQYQGDRIRLAGDVLRDAGPELFNRLRSGR